MRGRWRLKRYGSLAAMAAVASVGAALLATPAQAVEPPPRVYSNAKLLTTTHVPIFANGVLQLQSTVLGKITCTNTFSGEAWNAHEGNETTKPERAYGEVLGWGTSSCTAPEEILSLESGGIECPPACYHGVTVTSSPEMPVQKTFRQGEICIEATKTLAQCPNASEREVKVMISSYHRRGSSLPWKVELIRGVREEEHGMLAKVGLAEYGESGTAEAQSTKCFPKEETKPASFEKVPPGCIAVDIIFPQVPYEFVYYGTEEVWAVNGAVNGLDPSKMQWVAPVGQFFSNKGLEGEASTVGEVRLSGAEAVQLMTAK